VQPGETVLNISGTEFRRLMVPDIPDCPLVPRCERRQKDPSAEAQAGLHGIFHRAWPGKSTIANALMVKLMEMGGRSVTLLDGDIVRKNLSASSVFKEHRDLNIRG
jgi:sulfate adenylyltransferase